MNALEAWQYLIQQALIAEAEGKRFKTNSNRYHWVDSASDDELAVGRHKGGSTTVEGKPSTLHFPSFEKGWNLLKQKGSMDSNDLPRGVKVQQFLVRTLMSDVLIYNDSTKTIQLKWAESFAADNNEIPSVRVDLSSGNMLNILREWLIEEYYSKEEAERALWDAKITKRGNEVTILYNNGKQDVVLLSDVEEYKQRVIESY
jgi:hypothetical protein